MKNETMLSIFNKWYKEHRHGHFTYYKDGDIANDDHKNIGFVDMNTI